MTCFYDLTRKVEFTLNKSNVRSVGVPLPFVSIFTLRRLTYVREPVRPQLWDMLMIPSNSHKTVFVSMNIIAPIYSLNGWMHIVHAFVELR